MWVREVISFIHNNKPYLFINLTKLQQKELLKETIIERMNSGYERNFENKEVDNSVISSEERKVIMNKIKKVGNYKNTTTKQLLDYIDQIANCFVTLQTA